MLSPNFFIKFYESGCDEAGRGCLAGPVTAASVILPLHFKNNLLNDSKKLTEKIRKSLKFVIENEAISYAITHIEPQEIDDINILNASIKAMQECVVKLDPKPNAVIIDGNAPFIPKKGIITKGVKVFSKEEIEFLTGLQNASIVKGDAKYMNIAAASILAKTYRDEYMDRIHEEFPMYNWKKNKGYPTQEHRAAIQKYGVTKYHRMSFRLLPEQLKLDL